MRQLLPILFLAGSVQAQTPPPSIDFPKTVKCMPTRVVFETLRNEFKETPVLHSINDLTNKRIAITQSQTGAWTLIEFDERTACLLAIGDKLDTSAIIRPTM